MAKLPHTLILRDDARARGLKRFFTGARCRNGHIAERYTSSGHCVRCLAETKDHLLVLYPESPKKYSDNYKKKNYEKYLATAARYRTKNRKLCVERTLAWRAKNKEKHEQYIQTFRRDHPETRKAYSRKYYSKNAQKRRRETKEYRKKHPERKAAWDRTRRAKKAGSYGSHFYSDLIEIFKAQRGLCAYCRSKLDGRHHVDHIVPLAKGGTNDRRNIQLLCRACNQSKYTKDPMAYARSLGRLL